MRRDMQSLAQRADDRKRRPAEGWTVAEIVDHLAVIEEAFAYRTAQFFRPNETAAQIATGIRSFRPPPLNASVRRFVLLRGRLVARLERARSGDLRRTIRLRDGAVLTLADHLRAVSAHDAEHRRQLKALQGR